MKLTSLLLVLAMLLSFAACAKDPVNPDDSGSTPAESGDTTPAETTEDPLNDNLPAETFDGEEIYIWIDGTAMYYGFDLDTEYIEGDIVHEAVVDRNAAVSDRFDVTYFFDRDTSVGWRNQGDLRQSILSGDEYDIIEGVSLYQCPLAVYGCYADLATNPYVNFDKPWYQPFATDALRIDQRQYMASGFYDFATVSRTSAFYFNTNMVEEYQIENLYDLVHAGDWTFDKMLELCEVVSEDVNSDGVYDYMDNYGCASRWDFWSSQACTTGYQFTQVQDDGSIKVTGLTDQLLEIHENIYPFITKNNMYWSSYTYGVDPKYDGAKNTEKMEMFANDQILFLLDELGTTGSTLMREFGSYGLLPSPKYYDGQENYGAYSSPFVSAICTTTGDYDITSIIYEALQAESYKFLRPAYFETALSKKFLNDPQSVEMLDLILANITCEFSYNYAQAGLGTALCLCLAQQENLASFFQQHTEATNEKLRTFMEQVNSIPEFVPN